MQSRNTIVSGLVLAVAAALPAIAQPSPWPWSPQEPQGYYTQTWHNGFRAGEVAANQDMDLDRSPDLTRHPDYRNPDIGPVSDEQFREGFRFAYDAVVNFRLYHVAGAAGGPSD